MNSKKIIPLLIIMLLIVPVTYAANSDYKIPEAIKHIEIEEDGSCIITEEIVYDIEGTVNGTYRDIPLTDNQSVTNISAETPGYYNTLEIQEDLNKTSIKVWLYKDKDKTQKISNEKVKVIYKYTFNKGLKVYNDIAELQYMSWGNEWNSKVDSLKTFIKMPGNSSECQYWNNPDTYVTSSKWNDNNELETVAKNVPKKTSFEQRIIMPKNYIKSTENAQVIGMDAKAQIEQDQEKYAQKRNNSKIISQIFLIIIAIVMLLPAGIYLIFGREPKIDYNREYEYDLPTDSTPVEVNSFVVEDVGKVNFGAFNAVILDLIDRGYFKIISANSNNTIIKVENERIDGLKDYEYDLIKYLEKFEDSNGNISMADISEKETRSGYNSFMSGWKKTAGNSIPEALEKRYFNKTGLKIFKIFAILMIILGMGIFLLGILTSIIISILGIIIIIEAIILRNIRNTVLGRWTKEGKEYHDKWMNFKKYITDYSLIKEKPPASVQVWGKYLVYAAALGCANEATGTMQKYFDVGGVSYDEIVNNNVIIFTYHGGFRQMDSSFATFQTTDSSSGGGIGSVGSGGFGGGGGGTF